MLGLKFIKSNPTTHLIAFRGGRIVRQGAGLAIFYYAPTTNLVAVPIQSREIPFIFEKVTRDFQTVTIQGQLSYRIADPERTARSLNFTLRAGGKGYGVAPIRPDRLHVDGLNLWALGIASFHR